MSNVVTMNEARSNIMAGARPTAIVPQSMDDAYRMAKAVCMAGMAPKDMNTPEKCMVAIMHGLEVGLTPMSALQRIAVVNGRPTIWGDGAIGLVRASGLCEYISERIDDNDDQRRAVCVTKRKNELDTVERSFSVDDAKKAGLWGKSGPWTQYPDRMLQMRARAFCLRDVYADVLGGLYLREEIDDNAPLNTARVTTQIPQNIEPPPAPSKLIEAAPVQTASTTQPENPEDFRKRADETFSTAQSHDELQSLWDELVEPEFDNLLPPDQEELQGLFNQHDKRFEP